MNLPSLPALKDVEGFGRRHHRGLVLGIVALLAGSGIAALAVAPYAPDAALLPQRLISEEVRPSDMQGQLDALAAQEFTLNRNEVTRATDTAQTLLKRLGVHDAAAALFLRSDHLARQMLSGRGGKMVQARVRSDGSLLELVARFPSEQAELTKTHFSRLRMMQGDDGRWRTHLDLAAYATQMRLGSGSIRISLFSATDEAGIPDAVASQLADIFSTDIDFHRELRKGDTFSLVYEALTADGEPVVWNEGAGRVLAAEFVNAGRAHHAVWFAPSDGRGGYYDIDGRSKRRVFLASPMEFSRVTSGFAMRFHPLQQKWRQHLGVDYGAPTGTPVRSVGDGIVSFAGWQGGYGNVVQINHGNGKSTLYAHLSRKNVKTGERVQQGQRLGAVGSTGWSTGPHLHFEFRVNGLHQDPLRVAKASDAVALDSQAKPRFAELLRSVQAKLQVAVSVSGQYGAGE